MSPGKKNRGRREPTAVRKAEIVEAAMRILVADGTRRFTAEHIADEIGVTGGAIFRHFPSMDAVVEAVIERMEAILFHGFPPAAGDPLERLGLFFQQRVRIMIENPHVSRLLLSDHLAHAAGIGQAARIEGFKKRSSDFVLACLREAGRGGMLRGRAGPEEGTVLVMGAIFALAHETTRTVPPGRVENLSRNVWSVILSALGGRVTAKEA